MDTKDVDLGVSGESAGRLQLFQDALALGFDEFTFQVKGKPLNMQNIDAQRLEVAVRYKTRAWQTIDVDLGSAEAAVVDLVQPTIRGIIAMGLHIPSPVRCLGLSEQVAQKLHACTGPYSKGRARDILDILLIELLGELELKTVRVAAQKIFEQRATHAFPPVVNIPGDWHGELEALARELGYPVVSPVEIERRFRKLVDDIGKAT